MPSIFVATSNSGKLRDFAGAAAISATVVLGIPNFSSLPEVVEDGPTFEFLVQEWREAGLKGNALYVAIIEGARRTNKGVNKKLGL